MHTLVERGCGLDVLSGHGGGLLVDGWERRESAEADTDLRHHYPRVAQPAHLVAWLSLPRSPRTRSSPQPCRTIHFARPNGTPQRDTGPMFANGKGKPTN